MKLFHFNHERLIIIAVRVGLIGTLSTLGWELPLETVVNPNCDKSTHWDDLSESCKLHLYKDGSVPEETKKAGNLLFSVLRGSSYSDPRTKESGGHPSLDIVSVQGTPVYSIGDGTVKSAGLRNGYGNVVTVEHKLNDGTTLFSNYSHLDTITVKKGAVLSEGEQIGTVGRSGFTIGKRGNHLDFQITTADSPSHPYGYHDCETSYYDAVELRACEDKLKKYTIDPIAFFLENGSYDLTPLSNGIKGKYPYEHASAGVNNETNKVEVEEVEELVDLQPSIVDNTTQPSIILDDNDINTLLSVIVRNRRQSNNSVFSGLEKQYKQFNEDNTIQQFYAGSVQSENEVIPTNTIPYTITWNTKQPNEGSNVVGKILPLHFSIKDTFGAPFSGTMDEKIRIEYNKEHVSFAPGRFGRVVEGSKNIFITPKKAVNTTISIYYGNQLLGTETLFYSNN